MDRIKDLRKEIEYTLQEIDKFKQEKYYEIYICTYERKIKMNQEEIGQKIGMTQSTISRKLKEIKDYIEIKINERDKI